MQNICGNYQMESLIARVLVWADDRGILKEGTTDGQIYKTLEEIDELIDAMAQGKEDDIMIELGDVVVTLIIQAKMQGVEFAKCLAMAVDKIEKRSGKMIDGVFVKDKTLDVK